MTDYDTIQDPEFQKFKRYFIVADCAEPKAIAFYNKMGFKMRGCKKFQDSRIAYTKKVKRFAKIICAPQCKNTIRELRDLSYATDKDGNLIYDEFNIDPHTFTKGLGVYKSLENSGMLKCKSERKYLAA